MLQQGERDKVIKCRDVFDLWLCVCGGRRGGARIAALSGFSAVIAFSSLGALTMNHLGLSLSVFGS